MAERLLIRKTVLVALRGPADFADVYFTSGGLGGVIAPLGSRLGVGEECDLEVHFGSEGARFHTRGVARWRRTGAQKGLPAGVGVELLPSERRTHDLMLEVARGRRVDLVTRAQPRYPAQIDVMFRIDRLTGRGVTDNVSVGGCFIRCQDPPLVGSALHLKLEPPGSWLGIRVSGEVVWHQVQAPRGFGVRYDDVGRGARKKLEALVARIRRQIEIENETHPPS